MGGEAMRWRHLLPVTVEIQTVSAYPSDVAHEAPASVFASEPDGRSPGLVEALARLEAATRLRDPEAAARILAGLATSEDGQWLLRQCVAAGLREVATHIAEGTTPGDELGQPATVGVTVVSDPSTLRSVGPAA
jgi:hypothetical protein